MHAAEAEVERLRSARDQLDGRSRLPRRRPAQLTTEQLEAHRLRCAARARLNRRRLSLAARRNIADQAQELDAVPADFNLEAFRVGDGPRDLAPEIERAAARKKWLILRPLHELDDELGSGWIAFAQRELRRISEAVGDGDGACPSEANVSYLQRWVPGASERLLWPNGTWASLEAGRWFYPNLGVAIENSQLVYTRTTQRADEDNLIDEMLERLCLHLRPFVRRRLRVGVVESELRCLMLLELALSLLD